MKKNLIKLLLLFLVLSASLFISCKTDSTDNKIESVKSESFKTITQKIIYYAGNVERKDSILSETKKIDSIGNPVEIVSHSLSGGGIISTKEYQYNRFGKTTLEKLKSYSTEIKGYAIAYEYDDLKRLIKRTTYDETGNIMNEYISEFEDTLRVKELQYSPNGTLLRETKLSYDTRNNNIKIDGKYLDKPLTFKMVYEYDKDNKKIKEEVYRADDGVKMLLVSRIQIFYDEKGNIIKQLGFNGKGEQTVSSTAKYNDQKMPVERIVDNSLTKNYTKTLTKYGTDNKIIEEIVYYNPERIDHKVVYFY